jgi:hypothetical protein
LDQITQQWSLLAGDFIRCKVAGLISGRRYRFLADHAEPLIQPTACQLESPRVRPFLRARAPESGLGGQVLKNVRADGGRRLPPVSMANGRTLTYIRVERIPPMPEATSEDQAEERPCLHCMMVELIDDFFAEYPAAGGEPDTVDTDEVLTAVAKTVAELTSTQNGTIRQQMIEQLMRDIMEYDAEFRQEDATGSAARH